jgi:CTP:phosphocholine cytidylyltransferase-like protein
LSLFKFIPKKSCKKYLQNIYKDKIYKKNIKEMEMAEVQEQEDFEDLFDLDEEIAEED